MKKRLHLFTVLILVFSFSALGQIKYWTNIEASELSRSHNLSNFNKDAIKTFSLNITEFKQALESAPMRGEFSGRSNTIVSFPNENGKITNYRVMELPILSPELAVQNPNIKAYLGFSVENPNERIRFSVTPQGVQMMVSSPDKNVTFLAPLDKYGSNEYIVYSRQSKINSVKDFECLTEDEFIPIDQSGLTNRDANDQLLRTFRIAISTTGEYTNFWNDGNAGNGNAQQDALAQVVATLNRTNEVFEVDMAVTFQLVSGVSIIYPNAATDPYTGNLNAQLQSTLTTNIGEANYDIGHLFDFGGNNGNAGCIGCVCVNNQKGSGFSSHSFTDNDGGPYMSDYFDIDYVPHEIGHQMGANHTWSFGSEGAGVNFEPGSGTTIMGYAGITGIDDVQDHSDPYFHFASINQILNNLNTRTCWVGTAITNNPPVANAGSDYTIPAGTAFVLRASATDPNGADELTYTWEQLDNGVTTSGNFSPTKATGALWRSRPPSTSPNRFMPIFSRVLNGQLTQTNPIETVNNSSWETVSTVSRNLNFGLTVRDRSEANGTGQSPQSDFDTMTVTVDGTSGPFTVTSQTTNELWDAGSSQDITWNVAGTNGGAVNTPTVNILLSIDGGVTFPFTLASNVPNDGSQTIVVPVTGSDTTTARVIVEGNNNIFYAVNSSNFSIQASEFVISASNTSIDVCKPNNGVFNLTYNTFLGFNGTTTFSAVGLPSGTTATFNPTVASADGTSIVATILGVETLAVGTYNFDIVGTSGSITKTLPVTLNVFDTNFTSLSLITPVNGSTDTLADNAVFTWSSDINATDYEIELATDAGFTNIIEGSVISNPTYTSTTLLVNTQYWWRVRAVNDCGNGNFASSTFTTANISCNIFDATGLPTAIPDNNPTGINSILNVGTDLIITDINVLINITHTYCADLDIFIVSPEGTSVELTTDNGGDGNNYTNTIFDQEAATSIITGSAPFTGSFIPEGNLSILNGETSAGDWTLRVVDDEGQDIGTLNAFQLQICGMPPLSLDEQSISTFIIYPNPNDGEFTIRMSSVFSNKVSVIVNDVLGRKVYDKHFQSGGNFNQPVKLYNVESGIYLVTVNDGDRTATKKIIVN